MSDPVVRSGDDECDRLAWMRRVAQTMAGLLITATERSVGQEEDRDPDVERRAP